MVPVSVALDLMAHKRKLNEHMIGRSYALLAPAQISPVAGSFQKESSHTVQGAREKATRIGRKSDKLLITDCTGSWVRAITGSFLASLGTSAAIEVH